MDTPEVAIARYAARISTWALALSGGSLCVALCVFVLELRRWFDEGVRLSMSVMVDAQLYGAIQKDENTYLAITVTNRGSAATTITHMVLYDYPTRFGRWVPSRPRRIVRWLKKHWPKTFLVSNTGNLPLPHLIEPGRNWHGMAVYTPELEEMINRGRLYVGIVGSHSGKTLFKRVRRWTLPKNTKVA
jgi:hypothetical protein